MILIINNIPKEIAAYNYFLTIYFSSLYGTMGHLLLEPFLWRCSVIYIDLREVITSCISIYGYSSQIKPGHAVRAFYVT